MSKLPFPERVLHQHIATLGKTGSGKSSAMRVIAEHLLDAKRRLCIVDPKGDWWGLKSSADGKSAGYPIITFGDFKEPRATDVPVNHSSGRHVAELIATGNRPCVIGFRGWMPGQMTKFWLEFAPALFNSNEGELYVIIDEVHNFAPKGKIMDPDSGKMLHWTNRIMSEGRGLGLTFFIASQRPQKVHNDTLDNCETLIAMRMAHPASRNAAKDWMDGNGDPAKGKSVLETLAQLKRGEAWVWSPENNFGPSRVQFPMFSTFDSFAPPQLQKKISQSGWSEVDLDQVKQKLAAVIAEAKANDPKELKAEIARLKQEAAAKKQLVSSAPMKFERDEKREQRIAEQSARAARAPLLKRLHELNREIKRATGTILSSINTLQALAAAELPAEEVAVPIPAASAAFPPQTSIHKVLSPKAPREPRPPLAPGEVRPLGDLHRQIAGILAGCYPEPVKSSVLAVMCGKVMGGSWSGRISEVRSAGLLDDPGPGYVRATEQCAREYAGTFVAPTNTAEVRAIWEPKLGAPHRAMLDFLISRGGEAVRKEQLAEVAGLTMGGSFSGRLSELRSTGLMVEPGRGLVAANKEALFLNGEAA